VIEAVHGEVCVFFAFAVSGYPFHFSDLWPVVSLLSCADKTVPRSRRSRKSASAGPPQSSRSPRRGHDVLERLERLERAVQALTERSQKAKPSARGQQHATSVQSGETG
jgi:hypothetical protein